MQFIEALRSSWLQILEYMQTGGIVMWPLAVVSLVMWLLIVDRVLFIRRMHHKTMSFDTALTHVQAGRIPEAREYNGAIAHLITLFIKNRSGHKQLDRYLLDETVMRFNRTLVDRLAVIGVLAAIAPLLGLLGTVTGMITTFDVLAVYGTGNSKAMAGGISEALITTQTGLLIAIPGLYMKGFLDRRSRNLTKRISAAGLFLRRQL